MRCAILLVAAALVACKGSGDATGAPAAASSATATASAAPMPSTLNVEVIGGPAAPGVAPLAKRPFRLTDDGRNLPIEGVFAYHEHGESITVLFTMVDATCETLATVPSDRRIGVTIAPAFNGAGHRARRAMVGGAESELDGQDRVEVVSGDAKPGSKMVLRLDVEFEGLGEKPHVYRIVGGGPALGCGLLDASAALAGSSLVVHGKKLGLAGAVIHRPKGHPRLELSTSKADCKRRSPRADVLVGVDLTDDGTGVKGVDLTGDYVPERASKGLVPETSPVRMRLGAPLPKSGEVPVALEGQVLLDGGWEVRFEGGLTARVCE